MDTIPYFEAGHLAAPSLDISAATAPARVIDRSLGRIWNLRKLLRTPLLQPFRKALRPLIRWAIKPHVSVAAEQQGNARVGVNLKPLSASTIVLSILLGPLVFLMLLPLVLILLPVALIIGSIAVAITSLQTTAEEDYEEKKSRLVE